MDRVDQGSRKPRASAGTEAGAPGAAPKAGRVAPVARPLMRGAMALFYAAAGVVHIASPRAFLPIMPDAVPFPVAVIVGTGLCEVAGAAALMTRRWRPLAGVMLALYAVCVFPANIKHAVDGIAVPPLPTSWWYHGPRLLAQPVLVWWALFCAGVTDWPFRAHRSAGDPDGGRKPFQQR